MINHAHAAFGARLKQARAARYARPADAIDALRDHVDISARAYYAHEAGDRMPATETIRVYARLFGCDFGWLLTGEENASEFNQLTRSSHQTAVHEGRVRYIPILSAAQIVARLADDGHAMKTNDKLPLPMRIGAGERTFAWQIPAGDVAMVGSEQAFAPGTFLIVDPDQEIYPGQLVLARKNGADNPWIFRRFQADTPYSSATWVQLLAINANIAPISIAHPDDWTIAGRVIYSMHQW